MLLSGDLVDLTGARAVVVNESGWFVDVGTGLTGVTAPRRGRESSVPGNDTFTGNQFDNFLGGGPGNDTIFGDNPACAPPIGTDPSDPDCFGNDVLDGGEGNDVLAGLNGTTCISVVPAMTCSTRTYR